jgi:hypothetical protein
MASKNMLSKHIENVRQKSENYRMLYAFTASLLFTGVVASFWVFTWFIPDVNGVSNSASVASAVDSTGRIGEDMSPTGIVKKEAGNVFGSFMNSINGLKDQAFTGGEYEVKNNDTVGISSDIISTTTKSGITVEVDRAEINGGLVDVGATSSSPGVDSLGW